MRDLMELRGELDKVDAQLAELFEQRMKLCDEVADCKLATGKRVYDRAREEEKLNAVRGMVEGDFNKKGIAELFTLLMSQSRKLQYRKLTKERGLQLPFIPVDCLDDSQPVVYQGAEGSWSQAAAQQFFPERKEFRHVDTFRDAMAVLDAAQGSLFCLLRIRRRVS